MTQKKNLESPIFVEYIYRPPVCSKNRLLYYRGHTIYENGFLGHGTHGHVVVLKCMIMI